MSKKANPLSIHEADVLQPWGTLYRGFRDEVKGVRLPAHWKLTSKWTLDQRIADFEKWREATLDLLREFVWPTYDWENQTWVGESTKSMRELTVADLDLAMHIQHPPNGDVHFKRPPESPLGSPQVITHADLFIQEDAEGGSHMFNALGIYDRTADSAVLQAANDICFRSTDNKDTPVSFQFKSALQRPRPMQMALRFKKFDYQYEDAGTSITPSMCSGHCIQGLLGVGGLIEYLLDHGIRVDDDRAAALGHWAVDIGDRRVMAGVHYPADSLCSWILFTRMADSVFHRAEVKKILTLAIQKYSYIFGQIKQHSATSAGRVYMRALDALGL
jgi:hypothetical protein